MIREISIDVDRYSLQNLKSLVDSLFPLVFENFKLVSTKAEANFFLVVHFLIRIMFLQGRDLLLTFLQNQLDNIAYWTFEKLSPGDFKESNIKSKNKFKTFCNRNDCSLSILHSFISKIISEIYSEINWCIFYYQND